MKIKTSKTKFEKVISKLTLRKNKIGTIQTLKTKNNENIKIKNQIKKIIGETLMETYLKLINTIDKKNFANNNSSKEKALEKLKESIESSLGSKHNNINSHSLELILIDEDKKDKCDSKSSASVIIKKPNIFEGINQFHANKRKNLNNNKNPINENKNNNLITKDNKKIFMKLKEREGDTNDCEYEFLIFDDDNSNNRNNTNKLSNTKKILSSKHIQRKNKINHLLFSSIKFQNYNDNNCNVINMKESEKNNNEIKFSQSPSNKNKNNKKNKKISYNFKNISKSYIYVKNTKNCINHNITNCKKSHEIFPKTSYSKNKTKNTLQIINNANKNNLSQKTKAKKKSYSVFQLSKIYKNKTNINETSNNTILNKDKKVKFDYFSEKTEKYNNKNNTNSNINNNNNDNNNNKNNTNIINYSFGNKIIKVYYVNNNDISNDNKNNDSTTKYKIIKKEKNSLKTSINKNIKIDLKKNNKNNINIRKVIKSKNYFNNNIVCYNYKNENLEDKTTKKLVINKSVQAVVKKSKLASKLCNNYSYINKINKNPFNTTATSFRSNKNINLKKKKVKVV